MALRGGRAPGDVQGAVPVELPEAPPAARQPADAPASDIEYGARGEAASPGTLLSPDTATGTGIVTETGNIENDECPEVSESQFSSPSQAHFMMSYR